MPPNKWSHGCADVEHNADGSFRVGNKCILKGAMLRPVKAGRNTTPGRRNYRLCFRQNKAARNGRTKSNSVLAASGALTACGAENVSVPLTS